MLDKAFEALKTYEWGVDPKAIRPIDDAIAASEPGSDARRQLEARLGETLSSDVPQAAKDAVCRALRLAGTPASVPVLAALLTDEKLSHMARYALQAIPGNEATSALAGALDGAPADIKIGLAASLAERARAGEPAPAAELGKLLRDGDPRVVRAGALALGALGSPEAWQQLSGAESQDPSARAAVADAQLECAENLLAAGSKSDARAAYQKVLADAPSDAVRRAAELGIQASS